MNKYRDRKDYEINLAVAKKLGHQPSLECGVVKIEEELRHGKIVTSSDFDPCNNPADAMPIVIENGISLIFDTGCKAWVAGIAYWVDGCEWQISYEVERMNQYRAAMEVFLMMKDEEK